MNTRPPQPTTRTLNKHLRSLIDTGCAIHVRYIPDLPPIGVAYARIKKHKLRWCECFPEDQHHVHEFEFDDATMDERTVSFFENNVLVAYIEVTNDPDIQDVVRKWHAALSEATPEQRQCYIRFVEEDAI